MIRFRPLPILTLCSTLAVVVLILLGNWQWARFREKTAALHAAPATISVAVPQGMRGPVQFVYGALEGQAGWRILAPFPIGADTVLFADVGFAPGLAPPDRAAAPPIAAGAGGVLVGVAIAPKPRSPFAAKPDPARGVWYDVDLPAMARAAGYRRAQSYFLAVPYRATNGEGTRPNPFAHPSDPLPPERHVGYAITWWGLAAGLVVIYGLLHVRRGRLSLKRS